MRALEDLERLLEIAYVSESASIGAKQRAVVGIVQRGSFEHGRGLRALAGRPQSLRVVDRIVDIARVGAEAFAQRLAVAAPVGVAARCRGRRDGACGVG